jgi:AraC-like DNA-binding protein
MSASKSVNALDGCVALEHLFETDRVQIVRWRCLHDGPALRGERSHGDFVVAIPCRGSSVVHQDGREGWIAPGAGTLHPPGARYRTSHPLGCGDEGVHIRFRNGGPDAALRSLASVRSGPRIATLPARAQLGVQLLVARLAAGLGVDEQQVEAGFLALVANLARQVERVRAEADRALESRGESGRLADAAHALVAGGLGGPIRLAEVAKSLGASRFHLARMVKRQTGMPLQRHTMRLRLFAAADRLAARPPCLSTVAVGLGFYSHSHFTTSFRREFGMPPSTARELGRSPRDPGLGTLLASPDA